MGVRTTIPDPVGSSPVPSLAVTGVLVLVLLLVLLAPRLNRWADRKLARFRREEELRRATTIKIDIRSSVPVTECKSYPRIDSAVATLPSPWGKRSQDLRPFWVRGLPGSWYEYLSRWVWFRRLVWSAVTSPRRVNRIMYVDLAEKEE